MQTPSLLTLRIIWAALLTSTFAHVGALVSVSMGWTADDRNLDAGLAPLLMLLGAFALPPILFALRKSFLGTLAYTAPAKTSVPADPLGYEDAFQDALARYTRTTIVCCALGEAAVILGFVASITSHDLRYVGPAWLLGFLLIALQFPRSASIANLLSPAHQAVWHERNAQ